MLTLAKTNKENKKQGLLHSPVFCLNVYKSLNTFKRVCFA